MPLRFNTLKYTVISCSLRKILLILLLLNSSVFFAQSNTEDIKKEANKLFEDEEFTSAYKLYSQLVSNYPKDPVYNFRLGVCMIYSEPDKKKCLTYLQQASKNPDAPKETKFYLGKAYHINYQFNEAIKFYNDFKKEAPASMQKKLQVDREIQACNNGKRLLSNLSDLVVISKKTLNEGDYFRSYDLKDIGGKLLVKPEDDGWRTAADKKKKEKSVIYKSATSDRIYFSSYGPNTDNGRDIYYRDKLPNGEFTPPKKVNGINTEYDEDYPFLHPNGKTLYFASKGHNSMGGYDIFKSSYSAESDSWSKPVNLEFPINSPDDDFLFVTDSLEKTAFFSTGRQSLPGKIDVLRINTERKPIDLLALNGTVVKESADQSLKSKITVKNAENGQVIAFYDAQDNGDYFMDLPNGGKLEYTVETPGLETQSQKVDIPLLAASKPLRQTISYEKGKLKIINYFDEAASEDAYLQYMRLIEQKARLNVNVGENKLPELISMSDPENKNPQNVKGTGNTNDANERPTLIEDTLTKKNAVVTNTKTAANKQGLNNNQLADMAKQDAEESRKEAIQMKQDAADATELGNKQIADGDNKIKQAEEAIRNAETVSDSNEKKIALDNANNLKKEGEAEKSNGTKILEYSKALESDAKNKEVITDLNNQYVKEIETIISGKNKNPDAATKLESLQKEIAERSAQKSQSEAIYNEIKNNTEEKEKQVNRLEQDNTADKAALQDIKNDISATETELANTKKKKDKEPIQTKLNDLKTEQADKEKKIAGNEEEIKKQKDDLTVSKGELDLANKVKNETIAAPINTTSIAQNTAGTGTTSVVESNNNKNNQGAANRITNQALQEKYAGKITPADNNNKANIEESNTQLKNYNKEIDQAIAKDKADLVKAKNQQQKNEINNEIKQLEEQKRQNQQQAASNNKQIESLNKAVAANNSTNPSKSNNAGLEPIATNNKEEALKQLGTLDTKLGNSDNTNFEYNGYQNPQSQNLKIEADAKINEAAVQQKKLKELIAGATDQVKNAAPGNTNTPQATSANDLFKESEDLMSKAFDLRTQANGKTGPEKDELMAKAKEAEDLANDKHLQASDVLKNDNRNISETNLQNYETLKKENKATEMDLNESKRLFDEAAVLQKQADNIREEAASMTSVGARLGNISNAEEKEAEALNKQEQALFIMKKSSPGTALKKPVTSASGGTVAAVTPTVDLSNQLQEVNKAIADLANTKLQAYQKLYEANKVELDQLNATVKGKQASIDKTPALKTEYIAAENKITKSESLKKNSDNGTDNNIKLSDLIEATKAQTDALAQLSALDKKIGQPVATSQGENKGNDVATNNGNNPNENKGTNGNAGENKGNEVTTNNGNNSNENKGTNENAGENKGNEVTTNNGNNPNENKGTNENAGENKGNEVITNNGNNPNENKGINGNAGENKGNEVTTNNGNNLNENKGTNENAGENKGNEVITNNGNNPNENKGTNGNAGENKGNEVTTNNNNQNPVADTKTVDVQEISKKDTTAKDVMAYLDNNKTTLKNPGANQQMKNTIAELKQIEDEQKKLDEQSKNGNGGSGEPVTQLKAASEKLMVEAEDLSVKSFDLKTQANSKSGKEKDSLLTASKNTEDQALSKKVEAVKINEKANKASYENNNGAITELFTRLKTDNPDLATQLEQKNMEVAALKGQADQIRSEASTLTNNNAMLGSMMNAEEKEDELLKKQNDIIAELKKQYPTYQMKEASVGGGAPVASEEVKKKQSELNEKKFTALTNLTNSYSLEFETSKNNVPENLNEGQKVVKQNADDLNAESKRLLIKAVQTNDEKEKEKLLSAAAKTGNASVEQLNKLVGGSPVATNNNQNNNRNNAGNNGNNNRNNAGNNNRNNAGNNNRNNAGNNAVANNNPRNNNPRNNAGNNAGNNNAGNPVANAGNNNTGRINIEGLQVTGGNAYNANKPIPIDAPVGNGLVFRVQIGAFKTVLPNNTFKGLNPVNGENAANGYIRYTAGNFNKFENANAVKNDLQKLGYSDAFVVVYFNGKRITLREAMDILAREGKTIDQNPNSTAGITANANIPKANALPPNVNQLEPAVITKELEQVNGLLFTVQIGVYNKQATKRQLQNLKPIFTEKLPTGLYRYTAGIYSNPDKLISDKNKVVALGIRDAFVSAYLNGRKVPFAEGKAKLQDSTTKLEPENPIVFPEGGAANNNPPPVIPNANNNNNAQPNNNPVQPFTNNVQAYPAATPENGIKPTQDGVCFKVQIGAYSRQVPNDVAARFNAIRNWPIENKQVNNLYIYTVGNFVGARYAKNLLQEAKAAGITDAFITVYRDGKKVFGAEATQLMSQQ